MKTKMDEKYIGGVSHRWQFSLRSTNLVRKVIATFLMVAMMTSFGSVMASEVSPRYYTSCPVETKHKMQGRGIAWVYSGTALNPGTLEIYGFANQCVHCNEVVASEGNPRLSGILGKYRIASYNGTLSSNGVIIYGGITDSFYGNLVQDSFWAGYQF